jgi:transcriptional regulator GlxA family with amidase domain
LSEKVKILELELMKMRETFLSTELEKVLDRFQLLLSPAQRGVRTVRELSETLHLNERTLERVFPVYFGLHPKEYLRIQRVNEVCKLILVERKGLLQVACEKEFSDSSHLYKELKKFDLDTLISKNFAPAEFVATYLAS